MRRFVVMQNKQRLPRWRPAAPQNGKRRPKWLAAAAGAGLAASRVGHAFAQANTLGAMSIAATADLVDLSAWGTWLLWIFGIGFAVAAVYHAVMHRNGRATVPLVGVGLMLLCSGLCLGMPFIMAASAQSITGAAPAINQAAAVQPFQVQ
jgi:hypothetical protein